jgi:hypothetical protein
MKSTFAMLAAATAFAALLNGCAAGGYAGVAAPIASMGQAATGAAVTSAAGAIVNPAAGAGTAASSVTGAVAKSATGALVNSATGAITNTATGAVTNTATGAIANTATGAMATSASGAAVNSAAGAMVKSATGAMVNSAIGAATGGQTALTNALIQSMATSVFNGQIGQQVQSADQDFRLQKLGELMRSGKLDQPQQWLNPRSGNTLAVRPLGPEAMDASLRQPCRDLEETYTLANGQQLLELRRACLDSTGHWALVQ